MKNLERGHFRFATNRMFNMSVYAWNDKNPVHVMSTADATTLDIVDRRTKNQVIEVGCPLAVKLYNEGMQGVDQFNKLMSLFSMYKLNTFEKYYKKIAMVLFDFALVNAYQHFRMDNSNLSPKYCRVEFMENLQSQLINCDWDKKVCQMQYQAKKKDHKKVSDDEDKDQQDLPFLVQALNLNSSAVNSKKQNSVDSSQSSSVTYRCVPIEIKPKEVNDIKSQRSCCICAFEGRGRIVKDVNFCTTHCLRLCTRVHENPKHKQHFKVHGTNYSTDLIKNWDFICDDQTLNCWEKAHRFYIPNGLFLIPTQNNSPPSIDENADSSRFSTTSKFNTASVLYLQRKQALLDLSYKRISNRALAKVGLLSPSRSEPKITEDQNNEGNHNMEMYSV